MIKDEKMSSISIIIPVYNGENTIQRCLGSIIRQSCKRIEEIIIVDDGSTDRTVEVIELFAEKDSRICCVKKENGGVSSARNIGISNAHGDYIMFIDSDDEIKQDLVEKLFRAIKGYDMAIAGIELHQDLMTSIIGIDGVFSIKEIVNQYGSDIPSILINGPWGKLYRRSIIAENKILFDESLSLGEDTLFVFQYLRYCNQVRFVEYSAYIYNQIGNSSLMTKFRKDGYYNAKKVYGRLADIITQICGSEIPINYQRVYKNVLMVYIRKLIYNKRLVSKQYIKTIIKDYTEDLIVRNTSTDFDNVSCIQKVINILIDKRKNNLLYLLLKIHVMTRGI